MQQRGNKEFARCLPTSVACPSLFKGGSKITRSNEINEAKRKTIIIKDKQKGKQS
jgi:hypothetical protein